MADQEQFSFEQLLDLVEGRLSEEEAARLTDRISAQAAENEPLQESLDWLEAFQRMSRDIVLASPPSGVRHQLNRRFETFAKDRRRPGVLQRLVATLTYDSSLHLAVAGTRSATVQGQERQLVFSTKEADVALNIQPRLQERSYDIMGQVLPLQSGDPSFYKVQLMRDNRGVDLTNSDQLGEFLFEAVVPGTYQMLLSDKQVEILIPAIELTT